MDVSTTWQIAALIVLLLFSGFFSASETALMTLSKIRLRQMVNEEIKGAKTVQTLVEDSNKLLGSILVGNNIVNIGASALATSLSIKYFGDTGVGIATGVMTLLVLVFGEITPKSLAIEKSEKISLKVAKILLVITIILGPIVKLLMFFTNFFIKMLGGKINSKQPFITEEELKTIVSVSHEEGVLESEEKDMIYNVVEFGDYNAEEVMIPRIDMVAVDEKCLLDEIIEIFKKEQFSRIPVYEGTIDNIIGILNIKDLIFLDKNDNFDINKYIRKPYFTYEFKLITELFSEMRSKRVHMAIVLDEYGGTAGIITIEDLVEEIVGDIRDEYEGREHEIEFISENEFIVYGSTKLDDVNEILGIDIQSEDFDSLGGFILGELGRLPDKGETIQYSSIKFIVEKVDKNRIEEIRIIT